MAENKPRSPNYPALTLEKAVERTGRLYGSVHEHAVTFEVAAETLGYSPNSSGAIQAVAALTAYGLLDSAGRGPDRRVKVSKDGVLILNGEPSTEKWRAAVQEAAKRPPAHALLWERFGPNLPPSDAAIKSFLVVDQKFLPAGAEQLIQEYRETFAFAGLAGSPQIATSPGSLVHEKAVESVNSISAATATPPAGALCDTFSLPNAEGKVVLQWPERLSAEALADVEDWMRLMLRKIKRSVQPTPPPPAESAENQP